MGGKYSVKINTKIIFGANEVQNINKVVQDFQATRIMLVSDKEVRNTGIVDDISDILEKEYNTVTHFDEFVVQPQSFDCENGAELAILNNIQLIIAIGDVNSIDTAKTIRVMVEHNKTEYPRSEEISSKKVKKVPLICIPTTITKGSEVTHYATIIESISGNKKCYYNEGYASDVTIVDPELIFSLPSDMAAIMGMTALCCAIEVYSKKEANYMEMANTLVAIKIISRSIKSFAFERNLDNSSEIMLGSIFLGLAFCSEKEFNLQALLENMEKCFDIPYDVANAILLPAVIKYSMVKNEKSYAEIVGAMGEYDNRLSISENARKLPQILLTLQKELKLEGLLKIDMIDYSEFDNIITMCEEKMTCKNNTFKLCKEDISKILFDTYYNIV